MTWDCEFFIKSRGSSKKRKLEIRRGPINLTRSTQAPSSNDDEEEFIPPSQQQNIRGLGGGGGRGGSFNCVGQEPMILNGDNIQLGELGQYATTKYPKLPQDFQSYILVTSPSPVIVSIIFLRWPIRYFHIDMGQS